LDEYVADQSSQHNDLAKHYPGNDYEWDVAQTKAFKENMLKTWDKEEEPIPPERTTEELEAMLSKGECTITMPMLRRT
jgi:hypothetical protein